jgi:hypothetical protein
MALVVTLRIENIKAPASDSRAQAATSKGQARESPTAQFMLHALFAFAAHATMAVAQSLMHWEENQAITAMVITTLASTYAMRLALAHSPSIASSLNMLHRLMLAISTIWLSYTFVGYGH